MSGSSGPGRHCPAHGERHLRLPGTRNLRDVGGYPAGPGRQTRWRTLLRSDALDRLPRSSQAALLDLGLRQVVDLRWPHELDEAPSVFRASTAVRYRHHPILDNAPSPAGGVPATYRHILDTRASEIVAAARTLLEPDGLPALVGCAAGVDRTGVTVAVLLAAVGVPVDVVAADYALSAETFASDDAASGLDDWRSGPVAVDCRPEYMLEALDHLARRHGGARQLLLRNGLSADDADRLTELLTEPLSAR